MTDPARAEAATERPSKTRRKAESHELQKLGAALAELPAAARDALALDTALHDAIDALQRMRSHEARRRQLQLVGALMRKADVEPIRAAVERQQAGHAHDSAALHAAERWRAALIADDTALTRFAAVHPQADLQQLRTLVRNARRDAVPDAAPGVALRCGPAYRALFRFLREQAAPTDPPRSAAEHA